MMPASGDPMLRWQLLRRLTRAAEWPGDMPEGHSPRVGKLAGRLAIQVGLEIIDAAMIAAAARFHDVGNIAIAPEPLFRSTPLSPDEVLVVRRHVELGAELLEGNDSPLLRLAQQIALTHHERWDGRGYPRGARRGGIHVAGRIVAVADAWDAITHDRPFQLARSPAQALAEIRAHAGTQFDPCVVDALTHIARDWMQRSCLPAFAGQVRLAKRGA